MKKKMFAAMMVAVMTAGMVMPVSAADGDTTTPNNTIEVGYSQQTTYTLSIPTTVTLTANGGAATVGVSAVNTTPTEKVQVKISSGINNDHQVELNRSDDIQTKVVSVVTDSNGTELSNGSVVAEFQNMSTTPITGSSGNGMLNFAAIADSNGASIKAGTYTGTIVFEGSIEGRTTGE